MKLVEILANELDVWPSNADSVWQDYDGEIRALGNRDTSLTSMFLTEICDDCLRERSDTIPKNRVTKKMWEAEKAKQNNLSIVASDELWGDVKEMYNKEKEVFNPIYCRDRIKEIDALVESLEEERVSLVQALKDEGFALVNTVRVSPKVSSVAPVGDMSDWRNWKVGDHLEVTSNLTDHGFGIGEVVKIGSLDEGGKGMTLYCLNDSDFWFADHNEVKFHSRPQ